MISRVHVTVLRINQVECSECLFAESVWHIRVMEIESESYELIDFVSNIDLF